MKLDAANFFTHLIFHPFDADTKREQKLALITSIALGVLSFLTVHLACLLYGVFTKKSGRVMNESSIGTKGESGLKPTPTSESSDNGQIPLDKKSFGSASVEIYQSDILKQSVHAIVNPANTRLQGGGGLDGKIGAAAGQSIYQECAEQLRAAGLDQCDTGDAYITKSGKLAERNISYIIHAVGPRGSTPDGDRLLKAAYSNSLVRAHEMNLNSIAFPGISIGIFNFNPTRAAEIAYEAIEEFFATHPGTSIYDVRLCYWTSKNDQASLERMLELFQER